MNNSQHQDQIASLQSQHAAIHNRWLYNAESFVWEALGLEKLTGAQISTQQKTFLKTYSAMLAAKIKRQNGDELNEEEERLADKIGISVMSGKGTGKDACCGAWAGTHFSFMFPDSKVICTANSSKQLTDVLWSEFAKWKTDAIPPIRENMEIFSDKIYWKRGGKALSPEDKKQWWITQQSYNVSANPTEQAEGLGGRHAKYQLFILDEVSKIPDPVIKQYITTLRDPVNMIIMIFNPTQSYGYAVKTHTDPETRKLWECLQWDSEESEIVPRPFIKMMETEYGRDSNEFRVFVKGLPPVSSSDSLFPFEWVQEAVDREMEIDDSMSCVFGFDVGGGGDDSVICERYGHYVKEMHRFNNADTREIVKWASRLITEKEPTRVFIDNISYGSGVYSELKNLFGSIIQAADVRRASYSEKYYLKGDETAYDLRSLFEDGSIKIPDNHMLRKELAIIKIDRDFTNRTGKLKIESKKHLRKQGISSPNYFDALKLSYFWGTTIDAIKKPKDSYTSTSRYKKAADNARHSYMVA